jgi:ligand-binding SRPBCC domain-containing protein
LPRPPEEIFEFFSDAFQLQTLTPPWLRFCVLTLPPIHLQEGALIDYRLRVHGFPLCWQSRIEQWDPPRRFADVQTRGPYRQWLHEHVFESLDGGTLCSDIVEYEVYGGRLVHALLVRRDLARIFAYRQHILRQLFTDPPAAPPSIGALS